MQNHNNAERLPVHCYLWTSSLSLAGRFLPTLAKTGTMCYVVMGTSGTADNVGTTVASNVCTVVISGTIVPFTNFGEISAVGVSDGELAGFGVALRVANFAGYSGAEPMETAGNSSGFVSFAELGATENGNGYTVTGFGLAEGDAGVACIAGEALGCGDGGIRVGLGRAGTTTDDVELTGMGCTGNGDGFIPFMPCGNTAVGFPGFDWSGWGPGGAHGRRISSKLIVGALMSFSLM